MHDPKLWNTHNIKYIAAMQLAIYFGNVFYQYIAAPQLTIEIIYKGAYFDKLSTSSAGILVENQKENIKGV